MQLKRELEKSPLMKACAEYVKARKRQLAYRKKHGGDSTPLCEATRKAYNKLIRYTPIRARQVSIGERNK